MVFENYGLRGIERELVVAIEYQTRETGLMTPHSVFTTGAEDHRGRSIYDFEWCRRDQSIYYHESGGGGGPGFYMSPIASKFRVQPPRAAVWWNRNVTFPHDASIKQKRLSEAKLRQWGYAVLPEPLILSDGWETSTNPFCTARQDNCEYCSRCRDFIPWDNRCEHIWECWTCNHLSTPGDRCKHRRTSR